jgi:hypothetical protein
MFISPGSGGIGLNSVDGYKLKAGSSCINAGMYIPKNGGKDYWGNSVGTGKPNMGAYQSPSISATVEINTDEPAFDIYQTQQNTGILYLTLNSVKLNNPISVKIVAINGQILFSQHYQPMNELLIDTKSLLTKGVYIVSVSAENQTSSKKITIK